MKRPVLALLAAFIFFGFSTSSNAVEPFTSVVYFTGIGCPHCANVDPVLLKKKVRQGDLLVVEYEIYRDNQNAPLIMAYNTQFESGLGVPMVIADNKKGSALVGDKPILEKLDQLLSAHKGNDIVLPAGGMSFDKLKLSDMPRLPKIWFKNRIAIRKDANSSESESIKTFLMDGKEPKECTPVQDKNVTLSDDMVSFAKACSFGGWILMSD